MVRSFITSLLLDHGLNLMFDRIAMAFGIPPKPPVKPICLLDIDGLRRKWAPVTESDIAPPVPESSIPMYLASMEYQIRYNRTNLHHPEIMQYALPIIRRIFCHSSDWIIGSTYKPEIRGEIPIRDSADVEWLVTETLIAINRNCNYVNGLMYMSTPHSIFILF